ncbi:MAG: alpha/beta fold hydrolase, partial [Streptomycetaceae bacterium]|nr:alpha/beta fold hydrolase [Streptomycetaceae bacterium]
ADGLLDQRTEAAATPLLRWGDCGDGFRCATASVPLDYDQPRADPIDLAVIKLPAPDPAKRLGTLFVNFGGPGPSGVDRLRERGRWPWLFSAELRDRFDLVAWDSRAVARSAGARCFPTPHARQAYFGSVPEMPTDPGAEPAYFAKAAELAQLCRAGAGPILDHASTANTARDLELLRRAVGEPLLTYHGLSYGSLVGATYANLFPNRVRAMVLDGSMDFKGSTAGHGDEGRTRPLDSRQDVPRGIADTFDAFLRYCAAAGPKCAFSSGVPIAKWQFLIERARHAPIALGDGTHWTYAGIIGAAADLADPARYPEIAALLQQLFDAARPGPPHRVAARLRGEDHLANRPEAFYTIQCSDSVVPTEPEAYGRAAAEEDRRVPLFGRIGAFDMVGCAFWRGSDTDRHLGPWGRRTSAPILILNSRFDPATPLTGAFAGAAELASARVLVVEGAGHTTMYVHSACAERAKRDYLTSAALPPPNTTCPVDAPPFT